MQRFLSFWNATRSQLQRVVSFWYAFCLLMHRFLNFVCSVIIAAKNKVVSSVVAQVTLMKNWVEVSVWIYKLVWSMCPKTLVLLSVMMVLNSLSVFAVGLVLEWTIDQLTSGTNKDAAMLAIPITVVIASVWILEKITQALTFNVDMHVQNHFGTYFPRIVSKWGMQCFTGNTQYFEMLTRAKRGEYGMGYFVPEQFRLFNNILRAVMGIWIIAQNLPSISLALGFTTAVGIVFYVQARGAVKLTMEDRKKWSLKGEKTNVQNQFSYPLSFKALRLFGLETSAIQHIEGLCERVFPPLIKLSNRLMALELASIFLIGAFFYWANYQFLNLAVSGNGNVSYGRVAYFITTMAAVGYAIQIIVGVISRQAKGADNITDLVKHNNLKDKPEIRAHGTVKIENAGPPEIELTGFSFRYQELITKKVDGKRVKVEAPWQVEDLHCTFKAGRVTYLLGPNGSFKTTTLNAIAKLYPVGKGMINYGGQDLFELDEYWLRQDARTFPQTPLELRLTFRLLLAFAAGYGKNPLDCPEDLMWQALEMACIADEVRNYERQLDEPFGAWNNATQDLSGGQWRLANFAMFFMAYLSGVTKCLILDEPWVNLEPEKKTKIQKIIFEMNATIIIVSHEVERIADDADVVFLCRPERHLPTKYALEGTKAELLSNPSPEYDQFRKYCGLEEAA